MINAEDSVLGYQWQGEVGEFRWHIGYQSTGRDIIRADTSEAVGEHIYACLIP